METNSMKTQRAKRIMQQITRQRKPAAQLGFTLIEVMIVVAIVAMLAAIALPNYAQYIERARRNEAAAVMLETAQFVERYYTERRTYVGAGAALPTSLKTSPNVGKAYYAVAVTAEGATTFTVSAAPSAGYTPVKCGTLSVSEAGVRNITTPTSPTANEVSECFK
jgi:type IV pilus assembly protein PilE